MSTPDPASIKPGIPTIQTPSGLKPQGVEASEAYLAQIIRTEPGVESRSDSGRGIRYARELVSLSFPSDGRTPLLALAPRDVALLGLYYLVRDMQWASYDLAAVVNGEPLQIPAKRHKFDRVNLDWPTWKAEDMPVGQMLVTSPLEDTEITTSGLNARLIEPSLGVYDQTARARGCLREGESTVLRYLGEHTVPCVLYGWNAHKDIRRGLEAKLAQVFAAERQDDRTGRRVRVREYWGVEVRYEVTGISRPDTEATARDNRWPLEMTLRAEVPELELVVAPRPYDSATELEVDGAT